MTDTQQKLLIGILTVSVLKLHRVWRGLLFEKVCTECGGRIIPRNGKSGVCGSCHRVAFANWEYQRVATGPELIGHLSEEVFETK